jgi:carbamoyltransferase|tara:strand:- start:13523 stop:15271 length:1749 start_codon:yes stop_codon:yes gene_type:complete
MYILGINAYHADASACILKDNLLIAASEEERFGRLKHQAGFPLKSINFCIQKAGIEINKVDFIAVNSDPYSNFSKKILYSLLNFKSPLFLAKKFFSRKSPNKYNQELKKIYKADFINKIVNVDHHLSHINSAYFNSSFDEAACLSIDGFGDFTSTKWGHYSNDIFKMGGQVNFPHSMGIFYQSMTQYLGFHKYGDEYKVMGLAPYGKPKYINQLKMLVETFSNGNFKLNLDYFNHHKKNINFEWKSGVPKFEMLFQERNMIDLLSLKPRTPGSELNQNYIDLATSVQRVYEDVFLDILNNLHDMYKCNNLVLSGGCAMNSVANGKIYNNTKFKKIFIPPAAGDSGGAIGAAYEVIKNKKNEPKKYTLVNASIGPSFSNEDIKVVLDNNSIFTNDEFEAIEYKNPSDLIEFIVSEIIRGGVIGWFQGGMEWGPRALGNRSIICDPRRTDMKEILNNKIKRRESFRPFAPSILREYVSDWFENDDDVPFMSQVYKIKKHKRNTIPSVCHVDGTGRLQTVTKKSNKKYYDLIFRFFEKTNVPMILNTSFNENEPIVCRPEEALDTFLRTKMDILVMEDWLIKRKL